MTLVQPLNERLWHFSWKSHLRLNRTVKRSGMVLALLHAAYLLFQINLSAPSETPPNWELIQNFRVTGMDSSGGIFLLLALLFLPLVLSLLHLIKPPSLRVRQERVSKIGPLSTIVFTIMLYFFFYLLVTGTITHIKASQFSQTLVGREIMVYQQGISLPFSAVSEEFAMMSENRSAYFITCERLQTFSKRTTPVSGRYSQTYYIFRWVEQSQSNVKSVESSVPVSSLSERDREPFEALVRRMLQAKYR